MKRVKLSIAIVFVVLNFGSSFGQKDLMGWEFLFWNDDFEEIKTELVKHKTTFTYDTSGCYNYVKFKWNDFRTYVMLGPWKKMKRVEQRITFNYGEQKEAKDYYQKVVVKMNDKFGKYDHKWEDKDHDRLRLFWLLEYTQITLLFDYEKKLVDEFGAGSYWIEITYTPYYD